MPSERKRLSPVPPGAKQRVGANIESGIYNELVDYAATMDVDLAWFVRHALREFVERYREQLRNNPVQLGLDLGLR